MRSKDEMAFIRILVSAQIGIAEACRRVTPFVSRIRVGERFLAACKQTDE
jgi:hypothetical protein